MKNETARQLVPLYSPAVAASRSTAVTKRLSLVLFCTGFFALGLVTAALGPALADLAGNTGSSLAAVGSVFTALFLGALLAQGVAGPARDRLGPRPVLLAGLALISLGTLGLINAPWLWLALVCGFIAGLGHGAVDVVISVSVSDLFSDRRAAALTLVNVFFGVGAFVGPLVAGLALRAWDTALPALWLGAGLLLGLMPLMARWIPAARPAGGSAERPAVQGRTFLKSPLLWMLGLLLLVYVGIENGTGGWAPTYLERVTGIAAADAALATSGFWMAITASRFIGALIGTRLPAPALLAGSLVTAALGSLLMVIGSASTIATVAGILLLGLGFGPVFPTTIALVTAAFPTTSGSAAGAAVALGSLGGMLLPLAQGWVLERTGPSGSLAMTIAATLSMLLLFAAYRRSNA